MSSKINGKVYSSKAIEGTDFDAVRKFCQNNKVQAAHIIYIDKDGIIEHCGVWFKAKARNALQKAFDKIQ